VIIWKDTDRHLKNKGKGILPEEGRKKGEGRLSDSFTSKKRKNVAGEQSPSFHTGESKAIRAGKYKGGKGETYLAPQKALHRKNGLIDIGGGRRAQLANGDSGEGCLRIRLKKGIFKRP